MDSKGTYNMIKVFDVQIKLPIICNSRVSLFPLRSKDELF